MASVSRASSSCRNCETFPTTLRWLITTPFGSPVVPLVKSKTASLWPPSFGICNRRNSKRAGTRIETIHQKTMRRFNCGISSSNFKTRSGHGKSLSRSMNCVAEIAIPKFKQFRTHRCIVGGLALEWFDKSDDDRIWDAPGKFREKSSALEREDRAPELIEPNRNNLRISVPRD